MSEIERRRSRIKGVFLGFNLNIDVVVPLTKNKKLAKIIEENFPGKTFEISEVRTLQDLSLVTFYSFSRGKAAEYLISDEVNEEISSSVEVFEERVGGPVGIVGNVLSSLGIRCLIHGPSYSERQVRLLNKDLMIARESSFSKISPNPNEPDLIHWIFEFKRGERMKFGGKEVISPRENRVIFSHDDLNSKLFIREEYRKLCNKIAEEFPHGIISGHHLLTPKRNYKERLRELSFFIKTFSSAGGRVHLEMAFNPFPEVRREILKSVARESDSIGLNEVELSLFCKDLGIISEEEIKDPKELARCCLHFAEEVGADRVHLHTYGLYIECLREGGSFKPDKKALEISSIFAATKAKIGDIRSIEDLKVGEGVPKYHKMEKFAKEIDGTKKGGYQFVAIASRVVEIPKATVGIGDLISSSAFLFRGDRSEGDLGALSRVSTGRSPVPEEGEAGGSSEI